MQLIQHTMEHFGEQLNLSLQVKLRFIQKLRQLEKASMKVR